ncbi:non-homologous end-joining DNA ligase [Streptosporangium sp. KLBMP 9127]|nr:non-homologous end-joining DNA ligase [Streptosporangium sp. KLBMP 9127]
MLPNDGSRYALEVKWDGIRAILHKSSEVRLTGRGGVDFTPRYPEVSSVVAALYDHQAVLDGELVAFDPAGRPSFERLQRRMHVVDPGPLAALVPVVYLPFDLLHLNGHNLFDLPYTDRRTLLESLDLGVPPRFPCDKGELLSATRAQGLEGVIAKKLDAPYRPGRRTDWWIKVKNQETRDVVVGGWRPGKGRRSGGIGSLLVGAFGANGLSYLGHVGTGFTDVVLDQLYGMLRPLEIAGSAFAGELPNDITRNAHWVRPELVGEVAFTMWTLEKRLRNPAWRGLRPDVIPSEVEL